MAQILIWANRNSEQEMLEKWLVSGSQYYHRRGNVRKEGGHSDSLEERADRMRSRPIEQEF
jgi:hypothetical protein